MTTKTFRISIWEAVGGYATVEASTPEEAEAIAQQILDDEGAGGFSDCNRSPSQRGAAVAARFS
jgi:hypothetical protein